MNKAGITYLQPIPESSTQWPILFDLWHQKLKSSANSGNRIRWSLFSDLYLNQEKLDLKNNKFATELDLYAKAILLNLYLTVEPPSGRNNYLTDLLNLLGRNINSTDDSPNRLIWVFTKMLPTDWPLCNNRCTKSVGRQCISSNPLKKHERIFLTQYMRYLQLCATLKPDAIFSRHILVTDNTHSKFKNKTELEASFKSHRSEYFGKLHKDANGRDFGRSFTLALDNRHADGWPEILNDAVLFGSQPKGGTIQWEWAICTTYSSGHPVILLRMFDLSNEQGRNRLDQELSALISGGLDEFIRWVTSTREECT